jgi:uncharacterized protein
MKKLLSIASICLALNSYGQNFYFPKEYYTDSIALAKSMPALAKQIIAVYKETDKNSYFDNLFRYQITAEQYTDANNSLNSLRNLLKASDSISAKVIDFQYQTFASAKIRQIESQVSFNEAFNLTFPRLFNALPEQASVLASGYFDNNLKELHDNLYKLLNNQTGKDSITFGDAKMLCRTYNSYRVYNQIIPLAKPLIIEQENKQFIIEDSVLIKTRDGAAISAIVVRKIDIANKQPTIFVFNIYNSPRDKAIAKEAAINGYVGVVANTRGKRLSPQEIEPFEHDANDAYDIIDWVSNQPWCNGKVGMYGGSYLGFSQWAAVKDVHPSLKTIIPQVAVGIGIDYPMQNNIFMNYMLQWIHFVTNSKETDQAEFSNQMHWDSTFTKWYVGGKSFRSLDSIEGRPNKIFQRWLMHPDHDAYWQNMVAYKSDFSKINIPILTTTGYYDDDQLGAMYYFNQHHLYNKNADHYLVIGPYDHNGAASIPSSTLNGYTIDSVANIRITNLVYQWFNYILKDSIKPAILKDKINYQVMGTNEWKHAPSLSKMNNDTIDFYLSNVRVAQFYKLDVQPSLVPEFIRQEIDFKDRSDTVQNSQKNLIDSSLDVSNGISFISMPFDKSFEINGSFIGELKASINKKDMDVTIAMYELLPDGKYFTLGSYLARVSYAKNRSKRQLLQPGKIETIPINNTSFISKKINAGSRLVAVLGINKNANWQINYGTGKDVSDETIDDAKIPLQIKWYNNSVIKIPVQK